MQEREPAEVGRSAQSGTAVEKLRTTDREKLFCTQTGHMETGTSAIAVTDGEIDVLAGKIDVM
jgi:hypothetical protein